MYSWRFLDRSGPARTHGGSRIGAWRRYAAVNGFPKLLKRLAEGVAAGHRAAIRKAWQQAIVLLVGLRSRNDFDNEDLTAAVGAALKRSSTSRKH